jgi:ligand-binding sensor domain-containing protein
LFIIYFQTMNALRLIIFLLFIPFSGLLAQDLNFININTDNGLPSNECYRIAQDKRGYIWVSTEAGLVRYNSKDFVLFDKSKGIPSNNVYALDLDTASGRLWFATGNWDVGYILNDSVTVLKKLDFAIPNYQLFNIFDLPYKVKYNYSRSSLFLSSHHQTREIVLKDGEFFSKQVDTTNFPRDFLFFNDSQFSYVANLYNYERNYSKDSLKAYLVFSKLDSINLPVKKNNWFLESFSISLNNNCAFSIVNYLLVLNNQNRITKTISFPSQIQSVYKDADNNIWIGCKKKGVFLIKNGDFNAKPIHYLNKLSVSNILEDKDGGIWLTTLENGIYYCINKKLSLSFYDKSSIDNVPFIKVVNGNLFINNTENPLSIFSNNQIYSFKSIGPESNPKITGLIANTKGYLLSTNLFVHQLNNSFKIVKTLSLNNYTMGGSGIIKTKAGKVYLLNNSGFYIIKEDKILYPDFISPSKIKNAQLNQDDKILFTTKSDLYEVDKTVVRKVDQKFTSSKNSMNKIFNDSYNNIWLLNNNDSIIILNQYYQMKSALLFKSKGNSYRNILQTSPLNFFVCTNFGLIKISFNDSSFKNYQLHYFDKTNGLLSNDIYNIVKFKEQYYVSTSKGLSIIKRLEDLEHKTYPNTVINKIIVNDSLISPTTKLQLAYNENNISFQVDALVYKKITQREAFYKYKLQGWDNEFKTATGNTVTYDNLPPGNYKFIAKAFYDDNSEDLTPAEFSFTIKPVFWQTWWGILFLICTGMFLILLFIQWRIKRVRKQEAEKSLINKTIAEYKFTALKAQMNPHFVFNSINVIQNLILEKDKTEAYNSLGKFSRLIRYILNQSDSVYATIEEEITLIDLFVELNQLRVQHLFTFKKEIQPETLVYSIPSLIIQPFIENALWHGILPYKGEKKGEKKGEIILRIFSNQKNVLTIEIQDNGVGRKATEIKKSASSIYKSKGINLIKERLNAYTSMNKNSLAELDIIDLEENGMPLGTLVKLKISIANEEE